MILPALVATFIATFIAAPSFAKGTGPCKQIVAACEAGGYTKGGHKAGGKGLWKDCVKPLKAGQPVAGVTVDSSVIQACVAKKSNSKIVTTASSTVVSK